MTRACCTWRWLRRHPARTRAPSWSAARPASTQCRCGSRWCLGRRSRRRLPLCLRRGLPPGAAAGGSRRPGVRRRADGFDGFDGSEPSTAEIGARLAVGAGRPAGGLRRAWLCLRHDRRALVHAEHDNLGTYSLDGFGVSIVTLALAGVIGLTRPKLASQRDRGRRRDRAVPRRVGLPGSRRGRVDEQRPGLPRRVAGLPLRRSRGGCADGRRPGPAPHTRGPCRLAAAALGPGDVARGWHRPRHRRRRPGDRRPAGVDLHRRPSRRRPVRGRDTDVGRGDRPGALDRAQPARQRRHSCRRQPLPRSTSAVASTARPSRQRRPSAASVSWSPSSPLRQGSGAGSVGPAAGRPPRP